MADALSNFEFPKGKGLFTTFDDGDEFKVRVLTVDPVVTTKEFDTDGEISLSTKFAFVIYNWTLGKAQILNAGATITKAIQKLHQDEEWGANIQKMDIKISATGQQMTRKYAVMPMPKAETLTAEMIKECKAIDLDKVITDGQRMSFYKPVDAINQSTKASDIDINQDGNDTDTNSRTAEEEELGIDITEDIDLSDIPF